MSFFVNKSSILPFLVLGIMLSFPGKAFSEQKDNNAQKEDSEKYLEMDLEQLLDISVTTDSKTEKSLEDSPSIITVWTKSEIKRMGAKKLIDILSFTPGFFEVSTPLGSNVAIRGIHGYSSQHFVILLDGIPANDFITSSSPLDTFDIQNAERVEIIRGPGSALYGANALMGVINIITKNGNTDFDSLDYSLGSSTFKNISNNLSLSKSLNFNEKGNMFFSLDVFNNFGSERIVNGTEDILLSKPGQNISDGIQEGENLTKPSKQTVVNVGKYDPGFDVLIKYNKKDDLDLKLNLTRVNFIPQRPLNQSLLNYSNENSNPYYKTSRFILDAQKTIGKRDDFWGSLVVRPSVVFNSYDYSSLNLSTKNLPTIFAEEVPVEMSFGSQEVRYSGLLEYSKLFGNVLNIFNELTLVGGLQGSYSQIQDSYLRLSFLDNENKIKFPGMNYDAKNDLYTYESFLLHEGITVDSYGNIKSLGDNSSSLDGNDFQLGTYAQVTSYLFDKVGLTLGARFDWASDFSPRFSPRIAISGNIFDNLYGKLLYSSAFVYPSFLYRMGNSFSPYEGNTDIKPQSIDSLEMLLGYKHDTFRIELNGYYNKVKDFITYDEKKLMYSGKYKFTNYGNIDILGTELSSLWYFLDNSLSLKLGGSLQSLLSGTSPEFNVNGHLGGASKFPDFTGFLVANYNPLKPLNINLGFYYTPKLALQEPVGGLTFKDINGSDNQKYSSQAINNYDTQNIMLNSKISYEFLPDWEVYLQGKNLLNMKNYLPGSTIVPYPVEGLTLLAGISFKNQ